MWKPEKIVALNSKTHSHYFVVYRFENGVRKEILRANGRYVSRFRTEAAALAAAAKVSQ